MAYDYWLCKSLDQKLPYPHYSAPIWDTPRVVYGSENAKHDDGAYSDRLMQWDGDKYLEAWKVVTADKGTSRAIQEFLSNYHGYPVELTCVIYQTNRSSGYTVAYYMWKKCVTWKSYAAPI